MCIESFLVPGGIPGDHTQNFPSSLHQHHKIDILMSFLSFIDEETMGEICLEWQERGSYTDFIRNANLSTGKQMWLGGSWVMKDVTVSQPDSGAWKPPFLVRQPQEGLFLSSPKACCSLLCREATRKVFCNQDTSFLLMEWPQTSLRTWWYGNKKDITSWK